MLRIRDGSSVTPRNRKINMEMKDRQAAVYTIMLFPLPGIYMTLVFPIWYTDTYSMKMCHLLTFSLKNKPLGNV